MDLAETASHALVMTYMKRDIKRAGVPPILLTQNKQVSNIGGTSVEKDITHQMPWLLVLKAETRNLPAARRQTSKNKSPKWRSLCVVIFIYWIIFVSGCNQFNNCIGCINDLIIRLKVATFHRHLGGLFLHIFFFALILLRFELHQWDLWKDNAIGHNTPFHNDFFYLLLPYVSFSWLPCWCGLCQWAEQRMISYTMKRKW